MESVYGIANGATLVHIVSSFDYWKRDKWNKLFRHFISTVHVMYFAKFGFEIYSVLAPNGKIGLKSQQFTIYETRAFSPTS